MKLCKTTRKPLRTTLPYTVGPVSIPVSRHTYSLTDGWAWWSRIYQNKAVHSIHSQTQTELTRVMTWDVSLIAIGHSLLLLRCSHVPPMRHAPNP